ncbi:nucleotidyltransferase [Mycobacterium kubicae]|uniref:nucleotidyltransferase domain-containing protein n=1 Tax=Mycobacterium kubicae TaxID=120959 RepID=UPI00163EC2D0|nr:nucleotidyltransferase [Mycobacterium kubicae]QNI04945.1 nucleotidyltransferase [Mycobacterium kubicae]
MPLLISNSLIDRYAAGPSVNRTAAVKTLQENIRKALSEAAGAEFDTFLQGSYRNGTAVADINDVDIVALYDPWSAPINHSDWERLFQKVATILETSWRVTGAAKIGDKCVRLSDSLKADVVPAISRSPYSTRDPIIIYSRSAWQERPNYPRTHYDNGVLKQKSTQDTFKATVRLFKRWVRQYPGLDAPSFYIECAVHSVDSGHFNSYLPLSFSGVALKIVEYSRYSVIMSVAGDKDILTSTEWDSYAFLEFQARLRSDVRLVIEAMQASTVAEADRLWKLAFGE